ANSDGGAISQNQADDSQANSSSQEADGNVANANSGPVTITAAQDIAVTGPDSQIKSIAAADVGVKQEADQSNDNCQSPTADSDDGAITQNQPHDEGKNDSSQEANGNSATAKSETVNITGGGDVTVADSEVKSIAEAGSYIGQLASQFNGNDQF